MRVRRTRQRDRDRPSISLNAKFYERLEAYAHDLGVSVSSIVERVASDLDERDVPRIRDAMWQARRRSGARPGDARLARGIWARIDVPEAMIDRVVARGVQGAHAIRRVLERAINDAIDAGL